MPPPPLFLFIEITIPDLMAEAIKEEINLEEFEMKEETVFKEEESPPSSTVENTCTVYVQGEGIKDIFSYSF